MNFSCVFQIVTLLKWSRNLALTKCLIRVIPTAVATVNRKEGMFYV